MTETEAVVLVASALLVLAVSVEAGSGTLAPRVGVFLLALAMLAVCVALLHMGVR